MLTQQQVEIIETVERTGHIVLSLENVAGTSRQMLAQLDGIYGVWLPDWSPNVIIAKQGPNGTAMNCDDLPLTRHNQMHFNLLKPSCFQCASS